MGKIKFHTLELNNQNAQSLSVLRDSEHNIVAIAQIGADANFEQKVRDSVFDSSPPKAQRESMSKIQHLMLALLEEVRRHQFIGEMIENRESEHALPPIEGVFVDFSEIRASGEPISENRVSGLSAAWEGLDAAMAVVLPSNKSNLNAIRCLDRSDKDYSEY